MSLPSWPWSSPQRRPFQLGYSARQRRFLPCLETLEARETPAIIYGITYGDTTYPNQLITIDTTTGDGTTVVGTTVGQLESTMKPLGIAFQEHNLYTFDQVANRVQQLDQLTGKTFHTSDVSIRDGGEGDIAFRSDGLGFISATNGVGNRLYRFDLTAGSSTKITGDLSPDMDGLAFSPGGILYGLSQGGSELYKINETTGSTSLVGPTNINLSGGQFGGLSFDSTGNLFAVLTGGSNSPSYLCQIDLATGNATSEEKIIDSGGGSIKGVSGIAFPPPPSPPPGVTIIQSGGTTDVVEGGTGDSYTVVLNSQPISDTVTITLQPDNQVTVKPVNPMTLAFSSIVGSPNAWNISQTVIVTAVDDQIAEGLHTGTITHTATATISSDPYNGMSIASVTVNITDNDIAGTNGPDFINVAPSADKTSTLVTVNGKKTSLSTSNVSVYGQGGSDIITVNTPVVPIYVDGGDGTDKLIINGQVGTNSFMLTSSSLMVNGVAVTWAGIKSLTINGQGSADKLTVLGLPTIPFVLFNGNGGLDQLIGPDQTNTWRIVNTNAGILDNTFIFTNVENLTGGGSGDTFGFNAGKGVTGKIDGGGGSNILNYSQYTTPVNFNLQTGTGTGAGLNPATGGFQNIQTIIGGQGGSDKLIGQNQDNNWNISGRNKGDINNLFFFQDIENLSGGSESDTFQFTDGMGVAGKIDGGNGSDTLDYANYTIPVTVNLQYKNAKGTGGIANIENVVGGSTKADTLIAANKTNTWILVGANTGNIFDGSSNLSFTGIENLTGGGGIDTFIQGNGTWAGLLNGGLGNDTLVGNDNSHTWDITGANGPNSGTLDGSNFAGMENLRGGQGTDTFSVTGGSITGKIDGGFGSGINILTFTTAETVNLQTKAATNISRFDNLQQFIAVLGLNNTLIGPNQSNDWNLTGIGGGTVTCWPVNTFPAMTVTFMGFENLTGGSKDDTFNQAPGMGMWPGWLDGGLGTDVLNLNGNPKGKVRNIEIINTGIIIP